MSHRITGDASAAPESTASPISEPPIGIRPLRPKRSQVARACNACRTHRSKCDNSYPCSSCKSRGTQCSNSDVVKVATLVNAQREIQRLQQQVQALQQELQQERDNSAQISVQVLKPVTRPLQIFQAGTIEPNAKDVKIKLLDGIHIITARSQHETWYGPSSLFYFIRRVTTVLSSSLEQNLSVANVLPNGVSKLLHGPNSLSGEAGGDRQTTPTRDTITAGDHLSPTQEEYFLNLFWQAYHTSLFPILDESEFKEHYRSLWTESATIRKPSALVDIVIAMCMQYGISMIPVTKQGSIVDNKDATIAGRWYYRRCQTLLAHEMESPSLSTMQCHLLCCVYLCCGTFQNMADSACGLAVRTAYMLGLHLEPSPTLSLRECQIRKRTWWSLYILDSKIGMKLGRPFLLNDTHMHPSLPDDSLRAAAVSGSGFAPLGDNVTWLSFNLQHTKLFRTARAAYISFYDREIIPGNSETDFDDVQGLERLAGLMVPYTRLFEEWVNNVPNILKTLRQHNGRPYSTDGLVLEIEQFAPLWLQRQRLILELMYHNLCANFHRPFITFSSAPRSSLIAESAAIRCAAHAIALTHITHQVLSSTPILDGWHEAFQWQWNAAMTLVGFVLAYPQGESIVAARGAIDLSLAVFDIFGKNFAVSASAANIIRDLSTKIDFLAEQNRAKVDAARTVTRSGTWTDDTFVNEDPLTMDIMDGSFNFEGFKSVSDVFDMALAVDLWGDLDQLWPSTGDNLPQYQTMVY